MSVQVLVVDDSDLARTLVVRVLQQAGFNVCEARDGVEGAVEAFRHLPQVVLTDLEMPTMDGNQLLRLLKSDPTTSAIPVVILTSHSEAPSRFWGLATGADAYITKDAPAEELLAVVNRLIPKNASPGPKGTNLILGPLDVLARVASTLDRELMRATVINSLLSQGMGSPELISACRKAVTLLKDVVDSDIFAVGVAEAHTVSLYVNSSRELSLTNFDALNNALLDQLTLPPGAEIELTYDGSHGEAPSESQLPSLSFFPLPLQEAEGLLAVHPTDRTSFETVSQPLLKELLNHLALVLDNARLAQRLKELSSLDSLTRLLNHRAIFERLAEELNRASRGGQSVAVILCDIDHFKRVNDTYGHLAGDTILRAASKIFRQTLRSSDVLGRYGGEEFLAVLSETNLDGGIYVAQRLRGALEKLPIPIGKNEIVKITASFGVAASAEGQEQNTPDTLVALADLRLYQAKDAGRNCVKP